MVFYTCLFTGWGGFGFPACMPHDQHPAGGSASRGWVLHPGELGRPSTTRKAGSTQPTGMLSYLKIITADQQSCGKVMFSHLSVCSQGAGVGISDTRSLPGEGVGIPANTFEQIYNE